MALLLCLLLCLVAAWVLTLTIRSALRLRRLDDPAYSWRHQLLLALDQGVNALILGYADETISARCWRMQARSRFWRRMLRLVDWLFAPWERDHCYTSWRSEQRGTQLPPDYQIERRR